MNRMSKFSLIGLLAITLAPGAFSAGKSPTGLKGGGFDASKKRQVYVGNSIECRKQSVAPQKKAKTANPGNRKSRK